MVAVVFIGVVETYRDFKLSPKPGKVPLCDNKKRQFSRTQKNRKRSNFVASPLLPL